MTDTPQLVVYQRTDEPGHIYGVPNRDLTQRDIDALTGILRREVMHSTLFRAVPSEAVHDPLGELSNDEFDTLSPADKGARTRKANEFREEAERRRAEEEAAAQAAQQAEQDAAQEEAE